MGSENGSTGGEAAGDYTFGGLHHVQLAIPPGAEDLCREFWGGVLGMAEVAKPPALAPRGGCWFRGGGLEVHLGVERTSAPPARLTRASSSVPSASSPSGCRSGVTR